MGDIYARAADGSTPRARLLYVKTQAQGVVPGRSAYVLQTVTQLTLDPATYSYTWAKIGDYAPPSEVPPAPALRAENNAAITANTECVPEQYTEPDYKSTVIREIEYWRNGLADRLSSIPPTQSKDIQTWQNLDIIKARVRFVNSAGAGTYGAFSADFQVTA